MCWKAYLWRFWLVNCIPLSVKTVCGRILIKLRKNSAAMGFVARLCNST